MNGSIKKIMGFVAFRKGSQRLPLKNGALIGDKPLYQISLDKLVVMKEKGLIDAVVASTDSEEWAARCVSIYGDQVMVHERSAEVSDERAGEGDVIREFLSSHLGYASHAILLLLCTYPFMKRSVLDAMANTYNEFGESVFAVTECHHMPQKLLRLDAGVLQPYFFGSFDEFESNTKLLKERYPNAYHSTGAFLLPDSEIFSNAKSVWDQPSIRYVLDDSFHVDIDTEQDLKLARLYHEHRRDLGD